VADWNWPGHENKPLQVSVYSSCEKVELFLNNKSLGVKKTDRSTEFTASWEVPYQAGVLKAIGYRGKKQVNLTELQTAGEVSKINLTADRNEIKADGQDLCYITVELTDINNIRNPKAENLVKFEIEGSGTIIGVGNANPVSQESYLQPKRNAWNGRCLVIIKSEHKQGEIVIKASSDGLNPVNIVVHSTEF